MGLVVPREEPLAMAAGILNTTEAVREIRPILQGFELGLGKGIVIRDIGSAMGLGDIQIDQQGSHWLAALSAIAVGAGGGGRDGLSAGVGGGFLGDYWRAVAVVIAVAGLCRLADAKTYRAPSAPWR